MNMGEMCPKEICRIRSMEATRFLVEAEVNPEEDMTGAFCGPDWLF